MYIAHSMHIFCMTEYQDNLINLGKNMTYTTKHTKLIEVHLKKEEEIFKKKVNIFCHSFQKGKPIYYKGTQSEIFQAFISWTFDYGLQIMKTQNSVSQKIRILHKINKKRII